MYLHIIIAELSNTVTIKNPLTLCYNSTVLSLSLSHHYPTVLWPTVQFVTTGTQGQYDACVALHCFQTSVVVSRVPNLYKPLK